MQEMENIAVRIPEEDQGVAAYFLHVRQKMNALLNELGMLGSEILDGKSNVAQSGRSHPLDRLCARFGLNDLEQRSVRRLDEDPPAVRRLVVNHKIQILHIPVSQLVRIGRGDRCVFNSG